MHILSLHNNPSVLPHWQGDREQEELYFPIIGHNSFYNKVKLRLLIYFENLPHCFVELFQNFPDPHLKLNISSD